MRRFKGFRSYVASYSLAAMTLLLGAAVPRPAQAHCDTMDGPVVADARKALDTGDLTPVLKWIKPDAEPEIRAAFEKALPVRRSGPQARELADAWFFETLVRVHRAGEGVPYTGIKPAGTPIDPGIEVADRALETGSIDPLVGDLTVTIGAAIRERFRRASEAARDKNASVQAGREYVEAYVGFIHFVERLRAEAAGSDVEGGHGEE